MASKLEQRSTNYHHHARLNYVFCFGCTQRSYVPIPLGHLSSICHLVGPGGGELVIKPHGGGTLVNSSRRGQHWFFFQNFRHKYVYLDSYRYFYKQLIHILEKDTCGFRSTTILPYSISLCIRLNCFPPSRSFTTWRKSSYASFEELKGKDTFFVRMVGAERPRKILRDSWKLNKCKIRVLCHQCMQP